MPVAKRLDVAVLVKVLMLFEFAPQLLRLALLAVGAVLGSLAAPQNVVQRRAGLGRDGGLDFFLAAHRCCLFSLTARTPCQYHAGVDSLTQLLPYVFLLMRGLAVVCLIHALVTRQEIYWIVMLIFGALLGSYFGLAFTLIYAFTVFFPSLRGSGRAAGQAVARGVDALKPLDVRIRDAQEALAESDTLQNRADLANLQARAGKPDDAQATLQPLLSGIYADDPLVLLTSAQLDLSRHDPAAAEAKLNMVDLKTSAATRTRTLTLLAYAQEVQGKAEADATYQQAMLAATTEEPRARYAAYLLRQGKPEAAKTLLDAIAKAEAKATPLYRRQEREWFNMAQGLRKELK